MNITLNEKEITYLESRLSVCINERGINFNGKIITWDDIEHIRHPNKEPSYALNLGVNILSTLKFKPNKIEVMQGV